MQLDFSRQYQTSKGRQRAVIARRKGNRINLLILGRTPIALKLCPETAEAIRDSLDHLRPAR